MAIWVRWRGFGVLSMLWWGSRGIWWRCLPFPTQPSEKSKSFAFIWLKNWAAVKLYRSFLEITGTLLEPYCGKGLCNTKEFVYVIFLVSTYQVLYGCFIWQNYLICMRYYTTRPSFLFSSLLHCRFNLHLHWTTTIFILNLAFADSLYCAINLPLYAMQYLKKRWIWGSDLCYITTAFRYINAFADWMSVAMIAVSRCISLVRPELAEKLFGGRNGKLIILAIWVYANLLILPIYTKVSPRVCIFRLQGKCNVVVLYIFL